MENCCAEEGTQAAYGQMVTSLLATVRTATAGWEAGEGLLTALLALHLLVVVCFVCARGTAAAFRQ